MTAYEHIDNVCTIDGLFPHEKDNMLIEYVCRKNTTAVFSVYCNCICVQCAQIFVYMSIQMCILCTNMYNMVWVPQFDGPC